MRLSLRKILLTRTMCLAVIQLASSMALLTVFVPTAKAALEGSGCYVRANGDFNQIECPETAPDLSGGCLQVVPQQGSGGSIFYQIDCTTGNQGALVEPVENTGDINSGIGRLSGENEDDRVLNDCGNSSDSDCEKLNCDPGDGQDLTAENCGIIDYLVTGINFLSALALLSIIGSIVIAGYQYMTAKDNSGQVEAARKRITWAIIALGIFIFMYSVLNFVVPGGTI